MARDTTKTTLNLPPHQIIIRPLVTEKGMHKAKSQQRLCLRGQSAGRQGRHSPCGRRVVRRQGRAVHTQNRKGKPRRSRFRSGITKAWKKAIVTLDTEHRINFF